MNVLVWLDTIISLVKNMYFIMSLCKVKMVPYGFSCDIYKWEILSRTIIRHLGSISRESRKAKQCNIVLMCTLPMLSFIFFLAIPPTYTSHLPYVMTQEIVSHIRHIILKISIKLQMKFSKITYKILFQEIGMVTY